MGALWHGDQMLACDWSRAKGRFLTPVDMYKDVHLVIWMYIYIKTQINNYFGRKSLFQKNSRPPPCSIVHEPF